MKTVCFIPARGGSKGIPNKNLKELNGFPLLHYTIQASLNSKADEVWVSSDSKKIRDFAFACGAKTIARPKKISGDTATTESAILHFTENNDFDNLILVQATSPLTLAVDIDNVIDLLSTHDSALSVCNDHGGWLCGGFTWNDNIPTYDVNNRPRRQDMAPTYRENGALYGMTKTGFLQSNCRLYGNIGIYKMPRHRSFEIDNPEDLDELNEYLKEEDIWVLK